jgi:hypothetical protein
MLHPFNLDLSDLESLEIDSLQDLTDEEASLVGGGSALTTRNTSEEGGYPDYFPRSFPGHFPFPGNGGGVSTSMAVGEEGGDAATKATGEEGGVSTTMAIGEEGGGDSAAI